MLPLAFLWLGLAIIVGVAANTRGRDGFGWFALAVIISPLLAGLLVLALPNNYSGSSIITEESERRRKRRRYTAWIVMGTLLAIWIAFGILG